jgi:hypothetical protein
VGIAAEADVGQMQNFGGAPAVHGLSKGREATFCAAVRRLRGPRTRWYVVPIDYL